MIPEGHIYSIITKKIANFQKETILRNLHRGGDLLTSAEIMLTVDSVFDQVSVYKNLSSDVLVRNEYKR